MKKSSIPWERESIWKFLGFIPKNQKLRLICKWNNRLNHVYRRCQHDWRKLKKPIYDCNVFCCKCHNYGVNHD